MGDLEGNFVPGSFKIVLIGAGNVATRLGLAFRDRGFDIVGVFSPSSSAQVLAGKLHCDYYQAIDQIPLDADLALISTTDSSVASVAEQLPEIKGIVAHTSGSVPLDVLKPHHKNVAVIYPLQTFSKDVEVDVGKVPFFVEANNPCALQVAMRVAEGLSSNVHEADSKTRSVLHIAGVLSSNFPIYLLEMTQRVLMQTGLPLTTVAPLVEATIKKAFAVGPEKAMTGPARRGDVSTIRKQMAALPEGYDKDIYELISKAILNEFHPDLECV